MTPARTDVAQPASLVADYAGRRARVLAQLGADGALVLAAAPELVIGPDGAVRYVPNADLYYLTGYSEPEAVLVLCPSADSPVTLFVRPRDEERERWTGARADVDATRAEFGADAAYAIDQLAIELPKCLAHAAVLYAPLDTQRAAVDVALRNALAQARRSRPRTGRGVHTIVEPHLLLAPLRIRKDTHELLLMREAARITVESFTDAAALIATAHGEWQIEAAIEHGFRTRGASGPAFPSIVAAGPNATVLHYESNSAPLRAGDLLLIDAGARYRMYCADVTRTYPVSGRFTAEQRAVYDVVLHAHAAAIAAARVGGSAQDLDDAAVPVLVQGMLDLQLLSGSTDEAIETKSYKRYFPHRASHWLGLDVHDVGDYVSDGAPTILEPGMVLTVEPGLYIPRDDDAAPPSLRGIGVRLEDDVLVCADGPEVLTAGLPLVTDA